MPRTCSLCKHPDRLAIEAELGSGRSQRDVASQFGISRDVVIRHLVHAKIAGSVVAPDPDQPPSFFEWCTSVLSFAPTPGQRVLMKCAFGDTDPIDCGADKDLALAMFGGVETFLPGCRRQVVLRLGRGSGKTLLCVLRGVYRIEYADLSMCGPGDEACVMIVAPLKTISLNNVHMGEAIAKNTPSISKRVRVANSERITIERTSDGRRASLLCVPKSGGGAAARGKSVIDLIFDESEFVSTNTEERAVSDTEIIGAATPRLIPSGRLFLISTPYPFPSETRRLFKENYGKPTQALVALATTLQMRPGDPNFEMMYAQELARDPDNARREYLCEETATPGSFLTPEQIERAVLPYDITRTNTSCGWDLAFVSDSAANVLVERQPGCVVVSSIELLTPKSKQPLVPSEVCDAFTASCRAHNCYLVGADSWYLLTAREHAAKQGVAVTAGPAQTQFGVAMCYMRDLFRNGKIKIPDDAMLIEQLKGIIAAPKAGGGITITLPRRVGIGHSDLVPALCYAVWLDRRYGPLVGGPAQSSQGWGGGFQLWR